MSTQLNVRDQQKTAIMRMLNLKVNDDDAPGGYGKSGGAGGGGGLGENKWKTLIYDKKGMQIIAPLLKFGVLLKNTGITSHSNINNQDRG